MGSAVVDRMVAGFTTLGLVTLSLLTISRTATVNGGLRSADGTSVITCYCVKQDKRPRSCFQEFTDRCVCPVGFRESEGCSHGGRGEKAGGRGEKAGGAGSIAVVETTERGRTGTEGGSTVEKSSNPLNFPSFQELELVSETY